MARLGLDARPAAPFLKWPGGKRWLVSELRSYFDTSRARYVEPFLGGGAAFFGLGPSGALLADSNVDLINCYLAVRDSPESVLRQLRKFNTDRSTYLTVRAAAPKGRIERAARLIFLNRLAFNGIYRVNRAGQFNVPYGGRPETQIVRAELLRSCSAQLQGADLRVGDFRATLASVRRTDLVYLDPPYTVAHNDNGFRRYNEAIFSWSDQCELAEWATSFARRGGRVLVSNAWHGEIRSLYSGDFIIRRVERRSAVSGSAMARGQAIELLAVSRSLAR